MTRDDMMDRVAIDAETGCWIWTRGRYAAPFDYGMVRAGKVRKAHRVAYELWKGPIPEGMLVRHRCDTPACVAPDHLEVGTPQDNANDKVERGRSLPGELAPKAKFTNDEVREIRDRYAAGGLTMRKLGQEYGATSAAICRIINRQTYKHV